MRILQTFFVHRILIFKLFENGLKTILLNSFSVYSKSFNICEEKWKKKMQTREFKAIPLILEY
ncbi:hypothetical protein LEP1GSC105_0169 [Leptospira interrogans str. UI 12758]|uniref:Uncharacterized protein n=1 Tax=Leptospira interrogans str. UI 12758 TaxID=1049938 RepID=A0A0E2DAQ3_LEPIR|nr:hypothetical protein LEP1GSC105_0169 [Leptospira interrogans str. UI 12758]